MTDESAFLNGAVQEEATEPEPTAFLHGAVLQNTLPAPIEQGARDLGGRPNGYTEEMAGKICELIAEGGTLRRICNKDGIPSKATVFRWLIDEPRFAQQYSVALKFRAEDRGDEILEIADDSSGDYTLEHSEEGGPPVVLLNRENIARSKLKIDTRFKLMAAELPRKYGANPVADPLPPPPPEDDAPRDGTDAKVVKERPLPVAQHDPLRDALEAFAREAGKLTAVTTEPAK